MHYLLETLIMAHELDSKELVDFHEMVGVITIQLDTMYQLLIHKGYFTEAEFPAKMKEVQAEYQKVDFIKWDHNIGIVIRKGNIYEHIYSGAWSLAWNMVLEQNHSTLGKSRA